MPPNMASPPDRRLYAIKASLQPHVLSYLSTVEQLSLTIGTVFGTLAGTATYQYLAQISAPLAFQVVQLFVSLPIHMFNALFVSWLMYKVTPAQE